MTGARHDLPLFLEHLSSRRTGRIQHHSHDARVVSSHVLRVPFLDCTVDQTLAGIEPLPTRRRVEHVLFVGSLGLANALHCHGWIYHVPASIGPEDQAAVLRDVDWVDEGIRFGRDDKDVLFRIVAPQITCKDKYIRNY